MQKSFIWIVFLSFQITLSAQVASDTIITLQSDTIICKITKTDSNYIYYTGQNWDVVDNTYISISRVRKFVKNGESFCAHNENSTNAKGIVWQDKKLRLGFTAGYSNRLAENPPGIDAVLSDYYDDLKSGGHFGIDFAWYFNYKSGIGIKYSLYKSSTDPIDIWLELENGDVITGKMQEDIKINYYGLCYSFKINALNNKSWFYGNVGFGAMLYSDKGTLIDDFGVVSSMLGYSFDLGYDFGLTESMRLGLQISFFAGVITNADITLDGVKQSVTFDQSEYESLGRLDLGLALRFVK